MTAAAPPNSPLFRGAAAIAGALADRGLSYCERTIRRLHAEGKLGKKLNGQTSPITASAEEIERFLKGERT